MDLTNLKTLKPYVVLNDDDDGTMERVVRVPASARQRRAITDHALRQALLERGVIERSGCDCRHCLNGWDCCGRLFPSYVTIQRDRSGFRVSQHYARNV